jgi:hypothetical protein
MTSISGILPLMISHLNGVLGVSRWHQENGQKRPPLCKAESFAWLPQHNARPHQASDMDEGRLEEPSSTSLPSSSDRYEFPFLPVIRASPGSRDGGLKKSSEAYERRP